MIRSLSRLLKNLKKWNKSKTIEQVKILNEKKEQFLNKKKNNIETSKLFDH